MPKLTFWHQDFLNSPRLWKSLRFCFSKKESLHTVSTMLASMSVCQMLQICLSSAPPATFTSFQGFYLGSPVVDASPATLDPGWAEDFQPLISKVFIWVHQFHLSSRLCVVDFQPTRVFRVLGSGFTSRCCHPATSPLWAMGSGG